MLIISLLIRLMLDADKEEISVFDILVYINPAIFRYVNTGHVSLELIM
jgi:hypothetical protein